MEGVFGAVRSFILADSAVSALISTRFYPIRPPQSATYPLVTMQKIVEPRFPHLRGSGGLAAPRYQLDVWYRETVGVASFSLSQSLAARIRRRIDGYGGVLIDTSESPDTAWKVSILYDDSRDLFEPDVNGGYYRTSTDYVIWHRPVTS